MRRPLVATAVVAVLLLAGCATNEMHLEGSRAAIYNSVSEIAADSTVVAEVTVESQRVIDAELPYTVSKVDIARVFSPDGLAANFPKGTRSDVAVGAEINVRQLGSSEYETLPAPLLEKGSRYLLFLTPTALGGDAAYDFFVVGGNAGIYFSDGTTFTHPEFVDGDKLPPSLAPSDLTSATS